MLLPDALDILRVRLETIAGLTVTTDPAATPVPPMAIVYESEVNYDESMMRGGAIIDVKVDVYVSSADSAEGLIEARRYLSPHGDDSIRAAIEDGADGAVMSVSTKTGSIGVAEQAGGRFVAARFVVRVHLSNPDY